MKVFMSYYSDEEADAEDIANHLKDSFSGVEVFKASNWSSVAPGDDWQEKILGALKQADALLVLMSIDALGRSWINFEIGVAWAQKTRIIFFCHRGLSPTALPRPYGDLQAIDLNGLTHEVKLQRISDAVSQALNIKVEKKIEIAEAVESVGPGSYSSQSKSWWLRPAAHVGETATGRFLVGAVYSSRPDRARAVNLDPGEALFVRLFLGTRPEGKFINAMVGGDGANFFEAVPRDAIMIDATIRLASAFEDGENIIPLLVVDEFKKVVSS